MIKKLAPIEDSFPKSPTTANMAARRKSYDPNSVLAKTIESSANRLGTTMTSDVL